MTEKMKPSGFDYLGNIPASWDVKRFKYCVQICNGGEYTEVLFVEHNVRFIAVNSGVDSNNQQDNDFTPFLNIINEFYVKDSSKKVRAVMKQKGEAGEYLTTNPPYGYMKDPDNPKKHWIVDDEAAAVVRQIFAWCMEGYGPSQIAHKLKDAKVECPTVHWMKMGRNAPAKTPDDPYGWVRTQFPV